MTDGTDRGDLANRRTRVGVRGDGASTTLGTIDRAGAKVFCPGTQVTLRALHSRQGKLQL